MKNKFLLLLLMTLCLVVISNAQNKVTITGNIKNDGSETIELNVDRFYVGTSLDVVKSPVSNGTFSINYKLDKIRIAELVYKNQSQELFLEPGDDLHVDVNSGAFDSTIAFSGKAAGNNNLLARFNHKFQSDYDTAALKNRMLTTNVDEYEISLYESRKKQTEFIKTYAAQFPVTEAFKKYMENRIRFYYLGNLYSYPIIRGNSDKSVLTVGQLPNVMIEKVDDNMANNEDALLCNTYRNFLVYYIIYTTSADNGFNKFKDFSVSMDRKCTVAKDHLKGANYVFYLAKFMYDFCESVLPSMDKKWFGELKLIDKSNEYVKIVQSKCGEKFNQKDPISLRTEKNIPASEYAFKMHDMKGKEVGLSDFKGKTVYIDFWASWCGPCRQQMPFSKELHHKLTDKQKKNIIFLYISIDGTEDAWKKAAEQMGMEGVLTISPGNWDSEVVKHFGISSIPRYMIMDKNGNIVDKDAKRPSSPDILSDLIKYSEQ